MLESKARKILVIKFRHIGDVLLTAPLVTTLKEAHPGNRVSAAVKPGTEAMLEGHPDLDQLYILPVRETTESKPHFFKRYLQWIWELRKERFDVAINTTKGDRGVLISMFIGAPIRIGLLNNENDKWWKKGILTHPILPPAEITHTVIRNLRLAHPITHNYLYTVELSFSTLATKSVLKQLTNHGWNPDKRLAHIHPTSRWLFKCWRDEYMATVIDWFQEQGYTVAITSAPVSVEMEKINSILALCNSSPINLAGKVTLKQMAALSSLSTIFFGVDSAPMHIAASQQIPTIALFGPSSGFEWGPWPNLESINTPYISRNSIQTVGSHMIIQQPWDCVPCNQSGCDRSRKSKCLDELTPETVIPLIQQQLDKIE